ncbi:hypothetical protein HZH68_002487 [Vespula germanica]|uniref:Uncharacterized protein n=1 Tax=Vespula germanica TaxID=30212 RepID=A0A834U168_VESGE|nr:hypothetical protein HZH68_002487 [Vespula germanica]
MWSLPSSNSHESLTSSQSTESLFLTPTPDPGSPSLRLDLSPYLYVLIKFGNFCGFKLKFTSRLLEKRDRTSETFSSARTTINRNSVDSYSVSRKTVDDSLTKSCPRNKLSKKPIMESNVSSSISVIGNLYESWTFIDLRSLLTPDLRTLITWVSIFTEARHINGALKRPLANRYEDKDKGEKKKKPYSRLHSILDEVRHNL